MVTTTKPVLTPSGQPLQLFDEFERERIRLNLDKGLSECRYLRQTGRTTRMVIEALETALEDGAHHVMIQVHNMAMRRNINGLIDHYVNQYGISTLTLRQVHFCYANDPEPGRGLNIYRTFVDNAVTDARESEPRTSKMKYQKGQSVDIILKDVSIRDIQFAGDGDDLEIYRYVGMTANGVKLAFTEGQVVGSGRVYGST